MLDYNSPVIRELIAERKWNELDEFNKIKRIYNFVRDEIKFGFVYANAPQNIFHSWVEVFYSDSWYELEAFILDIEYLTKLQKINSECTGSFCGYGVAVSDFQNPVIEWNGNHTYIQSEGINQDFGVYNFPDELLMEHHQEMSAFKNFLFRYMGRHLMNRNVARIREKSENSSF